MKFLTKKMTFSSKIKIPNRKIVIIFCSFIFLFICYSCILQVNQNSVGYKCYKNLTIFSDIAKSIKDISDNYAKSKTFVHLNDILMDRKQPVPGKSIFFHETSCSVDGIMRLNARQACAIESAAKLNPNWEVFILFASPVGSYSSAPTSPIIKALLSYSNINFRNINLWDYVKDTPIENWFYDGQIFNSNYMNSHVSDLLRYLSLYKYGGTYLDLDVIVKEHFDNLTPNYAGAESDDFVAAGILNFEHNGVGHQISEMCLREFETSFDGTDWGNNGPGVITRVLRKLCSTENTVYMDRVRCSGFEVFPVEKCYTPGWRQWKYFFDKQYLETTLALTRESIIVHMWNKFSANNLIKVGSKVAYSVLAQQYCPKVFNSSGEYF